MTFAAADVVVEPAVLDALSTDRARVIVELRIAQGFVPEGELSEERVRAQRSAITAAQERLLLELAGTNARVGQRLETVPFLALEIGPDELETLKALPDLVTRVLADRTAHVQSE